MTITPHYGDAKYVTNGSKQQNVWEDDQVEVLYECLGRRWRKETSFIVSQKVCVLIGTIEV